MEIPRWYLDREPCPSCAQVHKRCGGHVQEADTERPCLGAPLVGQWRCRSHASVEERSEVVDVEDMVKTYAPLGALLQKCSVSTRGRTYVESLEDALHRSNTMVMLLSMLIETLPARAKATEVVEAEGTPRERTRYITHDEGMVGPDHEGDLAVHPYMTLYREWTQTQASLSKMASDLGLLERQVQVQEVHVRLMATTLSGILSDLGIDLTDPRTRSIIEGHLLRMETTSVDMGRSLTAAATSS